MTLSLLPTPGLEIETHAPAEPLREHVENYWALTVDAPPATVHVVPDGLVDLIFDLTAQEVFIGGPNPAPARYTHARPARLVGVSLKPGAVMPLLGVAASTLAPTWKRLEDVIGPAATALGTLIFSADETRDRLALLDAFLLARLFATASDRRVSHAIEMIIAEEGAVDIDALGRSAGASPRNLGRLFDAWVGLSPKRFARVVRLQAVLRRLQDEPEVDLTTLALDAGFADHAHLTREVRALVGLNPQRLSRILKP